MIGCYLDLKGVGYHGIYCNFNGILRDLNIYIYGCVSLFVQTWGIGEIQTFFADIKDRIYNEQSEIYLSPNWGFTPKSCPCDLGK